MIGHSLRGRGTAAQVKRSLTLLCRVVAAIFARPDHRHRQAYALGREHLAPVPDELLVGRPDRAGSTAEVINPEGVDYILVVAKRRVPVDLVGQRVPGEADDGHTTVAHAHDVRPFLPQPIHRLDPIRSLAQIGLGVHYGQAISVVVLPRDLAVPKYFARGARATVRRYPVFVRDVVVIAHDAMLA